MAFSKHFHAGVKKCHFGIFLEWAGMALPCQCGHQESLIGIQKIFLFCVPMTPQKHWKAKLERPHFFKVRSDEITVCFQEARRNPFKCYFVLSSPTKLVGIIKKFPGLTDGPNTHLEVSKKSFQLTSGEFQTSFMLF